MKQTILVEPGKFELREVEKPVPGKGQVLIDVKAVGICGSDIHAYHGKHPFMTTPIVLGHEMAGVVCELGEGTGSRLQVGDRVVMRPQEIDGTCRMCRDGRYNICQTLKVIGCQSTGGSSDYFAVDENLLYKVPDKLGFDEATVIEPLAVGVHAVKRPRVSVEGQNVVVIGAGTIGNLVAQAAKGFGAGKVMVTDVAEKKLEIARKCGADVTVNVKEEDIFARIKEEFGETGVDVVFECSANAGALNQALEYARKGTTIVIVAVYGGQANVNLANVQDREYELIGTLMYLEEDYLDAIRLVEEGKVDLKTIITGHFPLENVQEAYQYIQENAAESMKVILDI